MLIRAATSTLLVVDIQERLLPAIDDGPALVEYSQWLLRVARALDAGAGQRAVQQGPGADGGGPAR